MTISSVNTDMVVLVTIMNDKVTGFVLKQSDYKDYSVILTVLTKEYGKLSIVASGIRKPTSKNAGRVLPYTKSEFLIDYKQGKTIFTLKNVSLIQTYKIIHLDLNLSTCASMMSEITDAFLMQGIESEYYEEVYEALDHSFSLLENQKDPITILCLFCSTVMKCFGIGVDVDECVHCGSKLVQAISIKDGGFLCKECAQKENIPLKDAVSLKRFRLVSKASLEHYGIVEQAGGATFEDLNTFMQIIHTHTGIQIRSFELFTRIFKK